MQSVAQREATAKWEKKNYWKVLVRIPKELEQDIRNQSDSVNGFIVQAIIEKLEREV